MAEALETWRDKLLPASFRGAPFRVDSTEGQVGRRNVVHEYPQRELPLAEDLGRKAREFTLEGFVIGDNYMTARDALIGAIEKPGSGELVHPYRGRMQVVVTGCRVSESTAEGGMARFSLTFAESGEPLNPPPRTDTAAAVETAANEAQAEAEQGFFDDFSIDGLQDFVPTEALTTINDALDSVMQAATGIMSGGLLPEFTNQLFNISGTASSLMRFPADLASGLFGQIKALAGIADNPLGGLSSLLSLSVVTSSSANATLTKQQAEAVKTSSASAAMSALRPLFRFGSDAAPVPNSIGGAPYINKAGRPIYIGQTSAPAVLNPLVTPSRQQQAVNQAAVISLVQRAAVIEAARVSTQITPASYGEAITLRDELADKLETLAEAAPDNVYIALAKLRIAVIQDITARAADLSRTVSYTVPVTLPALVVAYGLYGDIDQADSMVARNHIRHPGFVPGGRSIEILTP